MYFIENTGGEDRNRMRGPVPPRVVWSGRPLQAKLYRRLGLPGLDCAAGFVKVLRLPA